MSTFANRRQWHELQREIAACRRCCERWPGQVRRPLALGEIPEPPPTIGTLFVGVAPTADDGPGGGAHFYSSSADRLRQALLKLLTGLPAHGRSPRDEIDAFLGARLFFVHSAKVRPVGRLAPRGATLAFCAQQHLGKEIEALNPRVLCFLGKRNAVVTAALFGQALGETPTPVSLGGWEGFAVVTAQPLRGRRNAQRTRATLRRVRPLAGEDPARPGGRGRTKAIVGGQRGRQS